MSADNHDGSMTRPPRMIDEGGPLGRALEIAARRASGERPVARTRVWRELSRAETPQRMWSGWAAGAAAAAVALVALQVARTRTSGSAESWQLSSLSGAAQLETASGSRAAEAGGALPAHARLRLGAESAARLQRGGVEVALGPGAVLRAESPLQLEEGTAAVRVPAQISRFTMGAGAYQLESSGGVFLADVRAERAEVLSQSAQVQIHGAADTVAPSGSRWAAPGADEIDSTSARALSQLLLDERAPSPAQLRQVALRRSPAGATPAADESAQLQARARAAESAQHYAEAAELYRKLAEIDGARAGNALYQLARLRLQFLGQPGGALSALDESRARFPEGPLALETALTSIEARLALHQDDATLREMDSFLSRYPNSERTAEVRWLRASLRLRAGACGAARNDLMALLPDATYGGDALFSLASCARRDGDATAERARLEQYVRQYPGGAHRADVQARLASGQFGEP